MQMNISVLSYIIIVILGMVSYLNLFMKFSL